MAASSEPLPALSADDSLTFRERLARHEANVRRAERAGDLPFLSFALSNVCGIYPVARHAVNEPVCARAESIARQLGRADLIAFAMGMRADGYAWLGQFDRAGTLGRAALEENPPADTPSLAPRSMILELLGVLAFEAGQPERSREYFDAAEVEASRVGWWSHVGWISAGRGRLLSFLGDRGGAAEAFDRAVAIAEKTSDLNLRVVVHWLVGLHEQRLQRFDAAIAEYDRCEELGDRIGLTLFSASCLNEEADALILMGRLDDAMAQVLRAERGLAASNFPLTDSLGVSRGAIALGQGRFREAVREFDAMLKTRPYIALDAWSGKARAYTALGDLDGAISSLEHAAAVVEETRGGVSAGEMRSSYFEARTDIYRRLFAAVFDRDGQAASERLFGISESLRARALVDRLVAAGFTDSDALASGAGTMVEAQARLEPGDLLIEYVGSGERLFALAVFTRGAHVIHLEGVGSASDLNARVAVFRDLVQSVEIADHLRPAAQALFRDLIEPLLATRGQASPVKRLFIATDGPLGALPFEALADEAGRFLGAAYPVIRIPSAAWLARRGAASIAPPRALVIANPAPMGSLPGDARNRFQAALPYAEREAKAIARAWPGSLVLDGERATEEATISRLSDPFGGLHFATHAVEDPNLPLRSSLRLAIAGKDPRSDGILSAAEIHQQAVSIPLVVLAACDSAQGRFRSGEGDLSLARAFLHAGATTVVGALFPADDAGAARFFEFFYEELSEGASVETALMGARRRGAETLRPRVWAAFAMSGAPGLRFAPPPRSTGGRLALVGIALALGAAGAVSRLRARRRRATPSASTGSDV